MFSTKAIATAAILAAAASGADAFATGGCIPRGVQSRTTSVTMQAHTESVADILARAAAMANGSVQASHKGGNSAARQSMQNSYNAPSATPASTETVSRSTESVADILARAAAMANGSVKPTHAGGNKAAAPAQSYSAPQQNESVADILARAAAMANGSVKPTHAGGNKATAPAQSYSAPQQNESVADILARAAAMANGSVKPTHAGGNKSAPAPAQSYSSAPKQGESVAEILARAAAMAR